MTNSYNSSAYNQHGWLKKMLPLQIKPIDLYINVQGIHPQSTCPSKHSPLQQARFVTTAASVLGLLRPWLPLLINVLEYDESALRLCQSVSSEECTSGCSPGTCKAALHRRPVESCEPPGCLPTLLAPSPSSNPSPSPSGSSTPPSYPTPPRPASRTSHTAPSPPNPTSSSPSPTRSSPSTRTCTSPLSAPTRYR